MVQLDKYALRGGRVSFLTFALSISLLLSTLYLVSTTLLSPSERNMIEQPIVYLCGAFCGTELKALCMFSLHGVCVCVCKFWYQGLLAHLRRMLLSNAWCVLFLIEM